MGSCHLDGSCYLSLKLVMSSLMHHSNEVDLFTETDICEIYNYYYFVNIVIIIITRLLNDFLKTTHHFSKFEIFFL